MAGRAQNGRGPAGRQRQRSAASGGRPRAGRPGSAAAARRPVRSRSPAWSRPRCRRRAPWPGSGGPSSWLRTPEPDPPMSDLTTTMPILAVPAEDGYYYDGDEYDDIPRLRQRGARRARALPRRRRPRPAPRREPAAPRAEDRRDPGRRRGGRGGRVQRARRVGLAGDGTGGGRGEHDRRGRCPGTPSDSASARGRAGADRDADRLRRPARRRPRRRRRTARRPSSKPSTTSHSSAPSSARRGRGRAAHRRRAPSSARGPAAEFPVADVHLAAARAPTARRSRSCSRTSELGRLLRLAVAQGRTAPTTSATRTRCRRSRTPTRAPARRTPTASTVRPPTRRCAGRRLIARFEPPAEHQSDSVGDRPRSRQATKDVTGRQRCPSPKQPLEPDLPRIPVRSRHAAEHNPPHARDQHRSPERTEAGATRPRPANGGVQRG